MRFLNGKINREEGKNISPRATTRSYYDYLDSPLWRVNREKSWLRWKKRCGICGREGDSNSFQFHHYKGYGSIWTTDDYLYIVPVCGDHHRHLHLSFNKRKKIPLEERELYRHFKAYKRVHKIMELRPSTIFNWFSFVTEW